MRIDLIPIFTGMHEPTWWEGIWEILKNWLIDLIPGLLPTIGFKYILVAALIGFVGYALFALVPATIIYFSGKLISKNSSGFGWTYLGTLSGGMASGGLFLLTDYLIDFKIDLFSYFGWFLLVGLMGMLAGGIFGISFKGLNQEETSSDV